MLGVGLIIGWVVSQLPKNASIAIIALLALAMSARSFEQTFVWRNSSTLLEHALRVNPQSWAAENSLAVLHLQHGQSQQAFDRATRAKELNASDPLPYLVRGSVLASRGDLPAATAEFRQAVDVAPNHSLALTNLGGILAQQGQFNDAIVMLQRAIAADPDNAQAYLNLGALQAHQNDLAASARSLQTAVQLSPTDLRARLNLGYVLLQLNRRPEAIEQFQAARAINPTDTAAREALRRLGISTPLTTP